MESLLLSNFIERINREQLNIFGIEIYLRGKETLSHRWRPDDRICIFSGTKTFTSMAVGICLDEGRLNLTDPVLDFFPEYKNNASLHSDKITIQHLLHMASGKLINRIIPKVENSIKMDYADIFFREAVSKNPGEHFFYSNACSYMLSRIVEKVSGHNLRDFLMPKLFNVLEIEDPKWLSDEFDHTNGASKLYLKTSEYLRLGIMILNKGNYDNKQIVSSSYLDKAITDCIDTSSSEFDEPEINSGYGYQLWKCSKEGLYRADGAFGQYCIVIPQKEAVIAITAHERKKPYDIIRAMYDEILDII